MLLLLQQTMTLYPKPFRLFGRRVAQGVLNREPILSRRFSLLERLHCNHVRRTVDQYRSNVNLYHSYENGGRADLLRFPHPSYRFSDNTIFDAGNYALQLVSLADPHSEHALKEAQSLLSRQRSVSYDRYVPNKRLRVGLISPDFVYHPVGRFIYMLLHAGFGLGGELHVCSTSRQKDSFTELAKDLTSQQGNWHDLGKHSNDDCLAHVRDLNLDVAIDLAGWTGGFSPALLPLELLIQINYLGFLHLLVCQRWTIGWVTNIYFPILFPSGIVKELGKLPRCFLAWHPFENLPEGRVPIQSAPSSADVIFGSLIMSENSANLLCDFGPAFYKWYLGVV